MNDPLRAIWADNLSKAMADGGWTDVKIAAELGKHQQTVTRWRTGETEIPRDMQVRLAELLDVDGRDLFPLKACA